MSEWTLLEKDLKRYPHFDSDITPREAMDLANNAEQVASHTFYPFILYYQRWNLFAPKGGIGKRKERPIRYAARRDAYIYARYRHELSVLYEVELAKSSLSSSIVAYRRIIDPDTGAGKCNINFAKEAFLKIKEMGDCCVIALDISSYFENLDHDRLKRLWARLLTVNRLPNDHFRVFEAITNYSVVEKKSVYRRLGYFGEKSVSKSGKPIDGYLIPYKDVPRRLCCGREFRQKIAGGDGQKSIVEKNFKNYGIPQGAPISDLLANIYLLDFDKTIADLLRNVGGAYYRYSDDILIIAPGSASEGLEWKEKAQTLIKSFGTKLQIKDKKSSVFVYTRSGSDQNYSLVYGTAGKTGLEYLGFRYDGRHAYIRNSTMSNLYRKVARAARSEASICARRYPDKAPSQIETLFNYERLVKRFGKVEDFDEKQEDYRSWTFWTYAVRAAGVFGLLGAPIMRQLRRYEKNVRSRGAREIARAVARRDARNANSES
jgi:hypothetical protein